MVSVFGDEDGDEEVDEESGAEEAGDDEDPADEGDGNTQVDAQARADTGQPGGGHLDGLSGCAHEGRASSVGGRGVPLPGRSFFIHPTIFTFFRFSPPP